MAENGPRILVVDDERAIRRFLRTSLGVHGYQVFEASTGIEAQEAMIQHRPDIVILDIGLPDMEGIEVTRQLREWSSVPIIILSVREQEQDKIAALDAGADDYLTKPFSVGELMARLRAAQRRVTQPAGEPIFRHEELVLDVAHRHVTVSGEAVSLTPTEYDLLRVLASHAGKVLTHRQLLREVWGVGYEQDVHLLRVNISNLRHKIEPEPSRPVYILTEPGVGYRFAS
ncbi:MAG: response regulator [Candidatus Promineifilaceae bacterium]|nr:response regulator [Candidatus Promineifilaceae bacterium]